MHKYHAMFIYDIDFVSKKMVIIVMLKLNFSLFPFHTYDKSYGIIISGASVLFSVSFYVFTVCLIVCISVRNSHWAFVYTNTRMICILSEYEPVLDNVSMGVYLQMVSKSALAEEFEQSPLRMIYQEYAKAIYRASCLTHIYIPSVILMCISQGQNHMSHCHSQRQCNGRSFPDY